MASFSKLINNLVTFFIFLFLSRPICAEDSKTFEVLQRGCLAGKYEDCGNVGAMYALGKIGRAPDFSKAYEFYFKACMGGVGLRCGRAGYMALRGQGVYRSPENAKKLFIKGCELNEGLSCNNLAVLNAGGTLNGDTFSLDVSRIKGDSPFWLLVDKGCGLKEELACENLVLGLKKYPGMEISAPSREQIKNFCKKGIVAACYDKLK